MMMRTAAIVLAAGESKRMGQNKLLLRLNDKTLIGSILDAMAAANINETVVVLGFKPQQLIEEVKRSLKDVKITVNEDYEKGMISSFQEGLRLVRHADAAFLILGDQPILDSDFLNVMICQMENSLGKALIVSPIYEGKKGHPLLFSKELFDEILNLNETETVRDVVRKHVDKLVTIEAPEWTTIDIDTPEDFARVRLLYEGT